MVQWSSERSNLRGSFRYSTQKDEKNSILTVRTLIRVILAAPEEIEPKGEQRIIPLNFCSEILLDF